MVFDLRDTVELKSALPKAVLGFAVAGYVIFHFGYSLAFSVVIRAVNPQNEILWASLNVLTTSILWVLVFRILRAMVRGQAFGLYWGLCGVTIFYNLILQLFRFREEEGWVLFALFNFDFCLMAALQGLAYRRANYFKVAGLAGLVLALGFLRDALLPFLLSLKIPVVLALIPSSGMVWLGFSYVLLSELDAIHKRPRPAL